MWGPLLDNVFLVKHDLSCLSEKFTEIATLSIVEMTEDSLAHAYRLSPEFRTEMSENSRRMRQLILDSRQIDAQRQVQIANQRAETIRKM